jgi:ADP-ribosyl-[dinitrogen reductase] hydrolase
MYGAGTRTVTTLGTLPSDVDAVVSLCRVQDGDLPTGVEQIDVRLIDIAEPDAKPDLDSVLTETVRLIEQLRDQGRTVLVPCVAAQSRTPTVAALYGARKQVFVLVPLATWASIVAVASPASFVSLVT